MGSTVRYCTDFSVALKMILDILPQLTKSRFVCLLQTDNALKKGEDLGVR
jgi:hypothetical protein